MENNYSEDEIRQVKKEIAKLMVQEMSPATALEMMKYIKKLKENE